MFSKMKMIDNNGISRKLSVNVWIYLEDTRRYKLNDINIIDLILIMNIY